ncbi:MAG: hypothetical protein U9O24_01985 [Campylobacterota bacterium]|nr:hypothetical protein [Campylobacterota bacterium]
MANLDEFELDILKSVEEMESGESKASIAIKHSQQGELETS